MKMANAFSKLGHEVEILTVESFFEKKNNQKIKNVNKFYGINESIKISYFKDNLLFYFEKLKPFFMY